MDFIIGFFNKGPFLIAAFPDFFSMAVIHGLLLCQRA